MPIWGRIAGYCGYCEAVRDWFIKEDAVICSTCGRKYKGIAMPIQDIIVAHCGYCDDDRH